MTLSLPNVSFPIDKYSMVIYSTKNFKEVTSSASNSLIGFPLYEKIFRGTGYEYRMHVLKYKFILQIVEQTLAP